MTVAFWYIMKRMAYDIVIKSGTVFDGHGNVPVVTDVGIKDGIVDALHTIGSADGSLLIHAKGKYVVPGFVDITNHSDTHLSLFKHPYLESLLMQGITTIIGGNCGASLAPLGSHIAIDAIRKWANPSDININWNTVEDFLKEIELIRPAANFATCVGYGTLRRGVIGDEIRLLSVEEREKVKLLLREGIAQGAFGLSLGLAYGHERVSTTEEIIEVVRVLNEMGGILKVHLRSEGVDIFASINEVIRIARETEVPIEISHLKSIGKKSWPYFKKVLKLIANLRESGIDINFDVSPYRTTGSLLYLLIPGWAREGGFTQLFQKIDDSIERQKIIEALGTNTLHYDRILVTSALIPNIVGKTLAAIAEEAGISNEEALVETIRANAGRVTIIGRTVSWLNTELAVRDPNSFISSDGEGYSQEASQLDNLIHPRSFGAFPHFWHRFVNDLQAFTPQEALKKITSGPAKKIGLRKRGEIKKGSFADVTIFDPRLIKDRARYHNPFRYPAGIEWVLVNGNVTVENGRYIEARAGHVLRKQK